MTNKRVFLGVGHGGIDSGAKKYVVEKDINLVMAIACKEILERHGVIVGMSRTKDENDDLVEEIKEANAFKPDVAIDIHNNAGGGDGFEAFCELSGGVSKTLAKNIEVEVKAIGQNSRGVKTKANGYGTDYFGFIREIKAPSIIVEGVFVDNATDIKIADTVAEQRVFGVAYAKGILKTLGIAYKEEAPKPEKKPESQISDTYKLVVACDIYMNSDNAKAHKNSVGKYGAGTYYVFKKSNGMINVTKKKGSSGAWINPADNVEETVKEEKPKTEAKKKKLYLPNTVSSWNVYPLSKAPVIGNECGKLNPKKFGGLEYEILATPQKDVVTIKTNDFGKVNIYVGKDTPAVIK